MGVPTCQRRPGCGRTTVGRAAAPSAAPPRVAASSWGRNTDRRWLDGTCPLAMPPGRIGHGERPLLRRAVASDDPWRVRWRHLLLGTSSSARIPTARGQALCRPTGMMPDARPSPPAQTGLAGAPGQRRVARWRGAAVTWRGSGFRLLPRIPCRERTAAALLPCGGGCGRRGSAAVRPGAARRTDVTLPARPGASAWAGPPTVDGAPSGMDGDASP
jgi:hypothetical protein